MTPPNQFALLLKRERKRRAWTQQDVADGLGTTRETVARWETGKALPAFYLRSSLSRLLGKRVEEFFLVDAVGSSSTRSRAKSTAAKTEIGTVDLVEIDMSATNSAVQVERGVERTELKDHLPPGGNEQGTHNNGQDGQGPSIHEDIHRLDAERLHLEIQMKCLEAQRKYIESTIDIAIRMIEVIEPACDAEVRSLTIEVLLTELQHSRERGEQEVLLPTFQDVRKALEAAKQGRTQAEQPPKTPTASPPEEAIEVRQLEVLLPNDRLSAAHYESEVDRTPPASRTPASSNEERNAVATLPAETPLRLRPNNPYGRLTPILDPHEFIGRAEVVQDLYTAIADKQSVAITGLRRIGKSSLLHYLPSPEAQRRFAPGVDLNRYLFVLADFGEHLHKSSEDFFNALGAELISQSRSYPLTLEFPKETGEDRFYELLNRINEQGFYPVILLDEFDKITLNSQFDASFFSFLRALAIRGRVSYVTASQATLREVAHRDLSGSPFFNIFYTCTLGPLDPEEARELVTRPAQEAHLPFTESEIALVLKLAGRHPFFIQRVCHFLFEEKLQRDDGAIDEQNVKNLAYRDLFPHFQDLWDRLSEAERTAIQDEAQQKNHSRRELPELSESAFFRQFVRHIRQVRLFQMTGDELENALNKLDDPAALGTSDLRLMKIVSQRFSKEKPPSAVEKGMAIREILNAALERLHGQGQRTDSAPDWRFYNILYYRYFRHRLGNQQIAARVLFSSERQYYRARKQAIDALLNVLFEMEASADHEE